MDQGQIQIMDCILYAPIYLNEWSSDNQPCYIGRFSDIVWKTKLLHIYLFLSKVTKFCMLWSMNTILSYHKYFNYRDYNRDYTVIITTMILTF